VQVFIRKFVATPSPHHGADQVKLDDEELVAECVLAIASVLIGLTADFLDQAGTAFFGHARRSGQSGQPAGGDEDACELADHVIVG
jgi:hypothetical protein